MIICHFSKNVSFLVLWQGLKLNRAICLDFAYLFKHHIYIGFFLQIVAMEALVRYSYNSRIKDITDLNVEVDIPDSNLTHTFHITGENIATLQRIDIPNVWGHINIVATGAGQAIAQLVRF